MCCYLRQTTLPLTSFLYIRTIIGRIRDLSPEFNVKSIGNLLNIDSLNYNYQVDISYDEVNPVDVEVTIPDLTG